MSNVIKNGFIYISRTGGTTLMSTVLYSNYHCGDVRDHSTVKDNKDYDQLPASMRDDIFLYTIMRNPFDKMLSCFYCDNRQLSSPPDDMEFKEYVKIVTNNTSRVVELNPHWAPQVWWLKDQEDKIGVDYIGRTETLLKSVNEILEAIGAGERLTEIGKLNGSGQRHHYSKYYDDETRKYVESYYEEDLDFLKIKFEERH